MRRNADFMKHFCDIIFQVLLHIVIFIRIWLNSLVLQAADSVFSSLFRYLTHFRDNHLPGKWFHYVIIRAHTEGFFCHILTSGRSYHDKRRRLFQSFVVFHLFHHRYSVQSRHNNIHKNNIRLRFDNHIIGIFSIICLSNYFKIFFSFKYITQHL